MSYNSYNKYAQITANALRASLKEDLRVAGEKRGVTALRYQKWENGVGGTQVRVLGLIRSTHHILTNLPSAISSRCAAQVLLNPVTDGSKS